MKMTKKTTPSPHKSTRFILAFLTFTLGTSLTTPGFAMNCTKATLPIEKKICANAGLRAADTRMNAAYAAVLKAAPDADIRNMLVRSQRRWLDARNKSLDTDFNDPPLPASQVREAIDARTRTLADRSNNGLIALALAERKWLAKYTGGPFTGSEAECDFLPDDRSGDKVSYACLGTLNVQHRARICSQYDYWATYRVYTHLSVSAVEGGKARTLAFCNMDAGDCFSASAKWIRPGTTPGWSRDDHDLPETKVGLPALDAEVWAEQMLPDDKYDENKAWFDRCLNASQYPDGTH